MSTTAGLIIIAKHKAPFVRVWILSSFLCTKKRDFDVESRFRRRRESLPNDDVVFVKVVKEDERRRIATLSFSFSLWYSARRRSSSSDDAC